jgi:hypothetical protein
MCWAARPNCHTVSMLHLEPVGALTASMHAEVRAHCILHARDLGILAIFSDHKTSSKPYVMSMVRRKYGRDDDKIVYWYSIQ